MNLSLLVRKLISLKQELNVRMAKENQFGTYCRLWSEH